MTDKLRRGDTQTGALAFVSVVFDAEYELLLLQARSFDTRVPPALVSEIVVIDNTVFGLRGKRSRRLQAAYGRHNHAVTFIRTAELAVDRRADGWRSQQAAKLLIARHITTPHYVVLDAKNHFIDDVSRADFVNEAGVPHGGRHSYLEHPLHKSLVHTLMELGADNAAISAAERSFPVTATPFVMDTKIVCACVEDLEQRSGLPFAAAFENARMLEFFYYSGWMMIHRPEMPVSDGIPIQAPVVWGGDPSLAAVKRAIVASAEQHASVLGVHRRVLMRAPREARDTLRDFWVSRSLLSRAEADGLLRRFRRNYRPAMLLTRGAERLRRWMR